MKKIMFMFAMLFVAGALALPSVSSADNGYGNNGGGWTTGIKHKDSWGGWSYTNGSYNTTVSDARLQSLINELMRLQALLAQLQNGNYNNGSDCSYERIGNSSNYRYVCDTDNDDVRSITVDFDDDAADVVVRYNDGDRDEFTIDADTREEAIDFIVEETDLSESTVRAYVSFSGTPGSNNNDDDVDTIKVSVDRDDNDATARVRYDDGDTETFDYDTDDKDDIISDLADDLDMDEDDVRDIATFSYTGSNNNSDDVESIDVEIDDSEDDATARVEFEDGTHTNYHFNTDDEDDIISDLADFLDLDEDEVEDLIDFDHV